MKLLVSYSLLKQKAVSRAGIPYIEFEQKEDYIADLGGYN